MSTKSTLRYGDNFHLYKEAFDQDAVHLELNSVDFEASPQTVRVRIPLPVWECIRRVALARYDVALLTDEQLEELVRQRFSARKELLQELGEDSPASARGSFIWGLGSEEEQLAHGLEWFRRERDQQKQILADVKVLEVANSQSEAVFRYEGQLRVKEDDGRKALLADLPNSPEILHIVSPGEYEMELVLRRRGD